VLKNVRWSGEHDVITSENIVCRWFRPEESREFGLTISKDCQQT
jgi:hypothetical protein